MTRLSEDLHRLADRATASRATTTSPVRRCRVLSSRFTRGDEHLTCELVCNPGDYQLIVRHHHVRIDRFPDAMAAMARVCVVEEELVQAGWHLSRHDVRDALVEHFPPLEGAQSFAFIRTGSSASRSPIAGREGLADARDRERNARR